MAVGTPPLAPTPQPGLPLSAAGRFLLSAAGVVLLTLALLSVQLAVRQATASLLYVLVVLVSASLFGLGPALLAAVLSSLAFNFFFISPANTLGVTSFEDGVRLLTFLGVAIIAGSLAGRAQRQAQVATRQAAELAALYKLSQTISAEVDLTRILPLVAETAVTQVDLQACRILLADADGQLVERADAGLWPEQGRAIEIALQADDRQLGVLHVLPRPQSGQLSPAQHSILALLAAQLVLVLERARLADAAAGARALAESDRLKSTLLSLVSHDLRTPLAAIKGAVTNLLDRSVAWPAAAQQEMLATIDQETDRLNRLVGDLLEMSRIEAGALPALRSFEDLGEVLQTAVARLQPQAGDRLIRLCVAANLPPAPISFAQIEQVLVNLLENALHYAPAGTTIDVQARRHDNEVVVEVGDRGPGVTPVLGDRVFEKFVRAAAPERHASGSGLGLAICKGLVEAHGGRIWVTDRPGGGALFGFTLPLRSPAGQAQEVIDGRTHPGC